MSGLADLALFDRLLESSSSLLDETANLSCAGAGDFDEVAVDHTSIAMREDDCGVGVDPWGPGTDAAEDDLLESILTGSEVGTMLKMCADDDDDHLGLANGVDDSANSPNYSSASSDDGLSDSGSSLSGAPVAVSPLTMMATTTPAQQVPQVQQQIGQPIEIVTHKVPAAARPLKVVKPTVVTLNGALKRGGPAEPIRIVTTKSSQQQSINTAGATIVTLIKGADGTTKVVPQLPTEPSHHPPGHKRRRTSASSNDSGVEELSNSSSSNNGSSNSVVVVAANGSNKYPPLLLTEEERRLCERENVRLPSHYPLSREEERNLKRIRRKIRNKVSAQDSRKRKKEYVDAMEDRVKQCTQQNEELNKKIQMLEKQNSTLSGQLRRLHQLIVNGGLKNAVVSAATGSGGGGNAQTSTAMMVLLLSTALFLLPGFKDQSQESKCSELDISQAVKMPPMPGQSRSLLHFAPTVKQEFEGCPAVKEEPAIVNNGNGNGNEGRKAGGAARVRAAAAGAKRPSPSSSPDHDYYGEGAFGSGKRMLVAPTPSSLVRKQQQSWRSSSSSSINAKVGGNHSYIEEDAPPKGYGPDKKVALKSVEERMVNVTRGGNNGVGTVVLMIPSDIK